VQTIKIFNTRPILRCFNVKNDRTDLARTEKGTSSRKQYSPSTGVPTMAVVMALMAVVMLVYLMWESQPIRKHRKTAENRTKGTKRA
jgi:cobalamin biosynthesis Mg chelatase CobN